jgi:hypothetical protein
MLFSFLFNLDWHHLGIRLKEHESGAEHLMNMAIWYDLRLRLQKNKTINKVAQRELEKKETTGEEFCLDLS